MSTAKSPEELRARDIGENEKIAVEKAKAEEHLPGWRTEVKIRNTGSTKKIDRFYTDPITGYTFRSLKDAKRYLKTGEPGRLAIKPKDNTCTDMDDEDENLHVGRQQSSSLVEKKSHENFVESTSAEDGTTTGKKNVEVSDVNLPDGIELVEEIEEKSESKEHMMMDLSPMSETSRHKRPLEYGSEGYKTRSKSSETSKSDLPHRASKRLAGINIDAPLPSSPVPKTRQATRLAGIEIDAPSSPEPKTSQARLPSIKVDAPPSTPPEPKTRQATRRAGVKIDASPPSLPEPKTRQAARIAGIKVEAPAPAPAPALPEPKTRQASRQAGNKVDTSASSLPERKTRQAARIAGIKVDEPPPEPAAAPAPAPAPAQPEPKTRQASCQAGIKVDTSVPLPPEPKTRQARRRAGIEVGASPLPEPKTRQATRVAGLEIDASPPSLAESKTRQATQLAGIRIDASPPSLPEPKTRQTTRLAGTKIDSPLPSPPEPRAGRQATVRCVTEAETRTGVNLATPKENCKIAVVEKSTPWEMGVQFVGEITEKPDGNADMDNKHGYKQDISIPLPPESQESREKINKEDLKVDEKQEFIISPATPSAPKEHYKEIEMEPTALQPVTHTIPKEQAPPTVVPPVNMGIQMVDNHHEKQVVNPSVSNLIPQDSNGGDIKAESSSMNFSFNDLWTDPCIEFAVKTLTGAIPFGDLNKADNFPATPLEVPLEELWTDPCIEFAVKTLTGAIPVGEDPCLQDYLQHQGASCSESRAVHNFSLPDVGMNFCQTELLSKHYETAQHSNNNKQQQHQQQQDVVGNGVLQKSGNVQGSNGQCSRPRFFQ